ANSTFTSGPSEHNVFIGGAADVLTPLLPGLIGGAAGFGLLNIGSDALLGNAVFGAAPDGAPLALIRVDGGIPGLLENFAGYDLLLLANLTDQAVDTPRLGIGEIGFQHDLMQGGFGNLTTFGGD